ncbi:hypothetical protein ABZ357_29395 [Streptomyces sp. NPDC005917]|uniref:hypothetical protein n=1 Tax=unclassified Streptomyces TaxID=2593676 RepID=UPI003406F81A
MRPARWTGGTRCTRSPTDVAHRTASAARAERILTMDGPGTAYGTHEDLLRTRGLYQGARPAPVRRRALRLRGHVPGRTGYAGAAR